MKVHLSRMTMLFLVFTVTPIELFSLALQSKPPANTAAARENAYRANNIGVALLEQFHFKEAADSFKRALSLDPQLHLARLNLGIALYYLPEIDSSLVEAKKAAAALPDLPHPHYLLGLIAKSQNRVEDAITAFQRVLKLDQRDVGANFNLAQMYIQQRKYADAIPLLRTAIASEPYNVSAAYSMYLALQRSGQREESQPFLAKFQTLRDSNYSTAIGLNYLEQGRYAEAIASTGGESELVSLAIPNVKYSEASGILPLQNAARPGAEGSVFGRMFKVADLTEAARRDIVAQLAGDQTLFDYDGDGDLDLLDISSAGRRLYRNDGGKFADVTGSSGLTAGSQGSTDVAAVAGDYDGDGKVDLFVLGYGRSTLYHNDGEGRFSDVTAAAMIPAYPYLALSAAFVDVDHDGDLDLFVAGFSDLNRATQSQNQNEVSFPKGFAGAPNLLLRNNGNGSFSDITAAARVAGAPGHAVAIVPTDYDNRRDIDLLLVNYGSAPALFRNLRDGTFADFAAEVGLRGGDFISASAADLNKDGFTDFFFGRAAGVGLFAMSDGQGRFVVNDAPPGSEGARAAQTFDYDNDGLIDLAVISESGLHLLRNVGKSWSDVTAGASSTGLLAGISRSFASGDLDADGDADIIARTSSGGLRVARNEGGSANRSLRVQLTAKVSNRSSVGAKLEARAGSLRQKLETSSASPATTSSDLVFGFGSREGVDAVRVIWPSGIVQAETDISAAARKYAQAAALLGVTEIDRKPSSCPYLYTWNGSRFEFVTDFMGGGEMGAWVGPGIRNHSDPDEYVRIRDDQLKERNGRYEIRVTNELEESLYVDRLQLVAVEHPEGTEIFPNEGLVGPPFRPFKLYVTRDARPPVSAVDDHGHDVLENLKYLDRKYPDDFQLHRIRGYAEDHTLTLDIGNTGAERTLLLLTAWTDYAFSSDNVAAHQAGLKMKPPSFQVRDREGNWKTVIKDVGIPVGRPQTIIADLTGKFLTASREIRIVTNMRIYWDQVLVDTSGARDSVRLARLEASSADLRKRGFSAQVSPDGKEPFSYDYEKVSTNAPWKLMPGRYTREGDVKQLLRRTDDIFVVSCPGDEIALSFDAARFAKLRRGFKRTFLLYVDGFSKEMDINSGSPDILAPLPFHGMTGYPYKAPEVYPLTRERRDYLRRYNTRVIPAAIPAVDAEVVAATRSRDSSSGVSRRGNH